MNSRKAINAGKTLNPNSSANPCSNVAFTDLNILRSLKQTSAIPGACDRIDVFDAIHCSVSTIFSSICANIAVYSPGIFGRESRSLGLMIF